ncbi:MAG: hypothetical protein R2778_01245 [Saprospiraceae bacterium]
MLETDEKLKSKNSRVITVTGAGGDAIKAKDLKWRGLAPDSVII